MVTEAAELNRIRLERNLTYQALAREIGIPEQTLYRAISRPTTKVNDRTLYRIRRFLNRQGAAA